MEGILRIRYCMEIANRKEVKGRTEEEVALLGMAVADMRASIESSRAGWLGLGWSHKSYVHYMSIQGLCLKPQTLREQRKLLDQDSLPMRP